MFALISSKLKLIKIAGAVIAVLVIAYFVFSYKNLKTQNESLTYKYNNSLDVIKKAKRDREKVEAFYEDQINRINHENALFLESNNNTEVKVKEVIRRVEVTKDCNFKEFMKQLKRVER